MRSAAPRLFSDGNMGEEGQRESSSSQPASQASQPQPATSRAEKITFSQQHQQLEPARPRKPEETF